LVLEDKDFPRGQQHWVTVKNGLLTDTYQYIISGISLQHYFGKEKLFPVEGTDLKTVASGAMIGARMPKKNFKI